MSIDPARGAIPRNASAQRGAALIITLSLLVLVTVAVLAFFIRTTANRKIESSSTARIEAEILSRSVQKLIGSELQREMLATSTLNGSDPAAIPNFYVLHPRTPKDAIPQLVLTSAAESAASGNEKFDNLIKQSVSRAFSFTSPTNTVTPQIKAIGVRTDTPSLDGRIISLSRWNQPCMIGDRNGVSGFDDPAQLPEWVLITRDGVSSTVSLSQAKDKTQTNPSYVIGRFAYNIYDEGGLIDINAAGYPSTSNSGDNLHTIKGTPAGINIGVLPGIKTSANMNDLVTWRNGTSKIGYPQPTPSSLDWYVNFVGQFGVPAGFLKPWMAADSSTDQRFLSRQDLIRYASSGQPGLQTAALPYLGTFSRDLDQPSVFPHPDRPRSLSNTATDDYSGNDVIGHDDEINPSFLSIRVTKSFKRNDDSDATPYEPLVKKRFALNHLAWLTYKGPSAGRSMSDTDIKSLLASGTGITEEFLQQGTKENIKRYFGLTWDSSGGYWTYDHGITSSQGNPIVGTLGKVRDAEREADFFELLKASITVGALGKGATNPNRQPSPLLEEASDYAYDTKVDYAILQIGANILDQFDGDGYPTRIRFNDGNKVEEFRGGENLPLLYRMRSNTTFVAMPVPAPSHDTTNPDEGGADPWTGPTDLTDCGMYVVFWQPEIWNPYDIRSSMGSPRPSSFRLIADGAPLDVDGNSITGAYNVNQNITQCFLKGTPLNGRYYSYAMDVAKTPASYNTTTSPASTAWNGDNTALTFTDSSGTLFREPTMLSKPNFPVGSNLALGPNNLLRSIFTHPQLQKYWDASGGGVKCLNDPSSIGSPVPYIGLYYGQGPLRWVHTSGAKSYIMTATENDAATSTTSGSSGNTIRMQYDNGGTWITYGQSYVPNIRQSQPMVVLKTGQPSSSFSAVGRRQWIGTVDPRTRRFGNPGAGDRGSIYASFLPLLDSSKNMYGTDRPDSSSGWGWFSSSKDATGAPDTVCMPEVGGWYPRPASTWVPDKPSPPVMYYRPGLISQNNPNATGNSWGSQVDGDSTQQYYADPDGVVRRAMGAFVPPTGNTAPASTTIGLPLAKTAGSGALANQSQSRPVILNRPFRSVSELGYAFSDTPWKNLDLSTPESGYSALLDVFCLQNTERVDPVIAGRVNLNTRRKPVLEAILGDAGKDVNNVASAGLTSGESASLASLLVARTMTDQSNGGKGPLVNIGDLVGRWVGKTAAPLGGTDGSLSYDGFSADLGSVFSADPTMNNIQRFRNAPIRALSAVGTTRVWNLLIDLIVQSGRFPSHASTFSNFIVEGEQHCWLHLAIDRATGEIVDQQLEIVRE